MFVSDRRQSGATSVPGTAPGAQAFSSTSGPQDRSSFHSRWGNRSVLGYGPRPGVKLRGRRAARHRTL